ncbi:MAG: ATP-binding cassette domain-containing protein [Pirellulales bacterium]
MNPQIVLQCRDVGHDYGRRPILYDVNVDIAAGQIVALVGPSGCGKSTLLRAILGTHPPRDGQVIIDGQPMLRPNRNVGIVYQNYSLYDYMTALENVVFGLMLERTSLPFRFFRYPAWRRMRRDLEDEAMAMLDKVHLGTAAKLYPSEMSGGMRQRVALAQALVMQPKILLLDEPFGALDEATREELQVMLLELYAENLDHLTEGVEPPYTIVMVTHELDEALYVADRVIGLSQYHRDGGQGATVVYDRPAPVFRPNDVRDFEIFVQQKEEIRNVVFDPESMRHHSEFVSFWPQRPRQAEQAAVLADRQLARAQTPP